MKRLVRYLLRKLKILNWIRIVRFKYKYRVSIGRFRSQQEVVLKVRSEAVRFSVADPFSALFFSTQFRDGNYEKDGVELLLSNLENSNIVFDVGANIGYFTCIVGKFCSVGRIHAFDLGTENIKILRRNVKLNMLTNVVIEHCAVSDSAGMVKVMDSAVGNAVQKILHPKLKNVDVVEVPSIKLDDYAASNGKPDLVKIDVEGAEMKVLKGMKRILTTNVKLLIEIHDKELIDYGSSRVEVLDFLKSNGFTAATIDNDQKKNLLVFATKP